MRPLEAKRVILASHSDTGHRKRSVWPIRTEDLVRKWITVQTDTARQPPGLGSWYWLNTAWFPCDQGEPETPPRPSTATRQLLRMSYKKEHATIVMYCVFTMTGWSLAFRFNRKSDKIWAVRGTERREERKAIESSTTAKCSSHRSTSLPFPPSFQEDVK